MDKSQNHDGSEASALNSIVKIRNIVEEKNLKIIKNEARIFYTQREIDELESGIKKFIEDGKKLDQENALLTKDTEMLVTSIDIARQSLARNSDMVVNLRQENDKQEAYVQDLANQSKITYQEFLEKYKKARIVFETYSPLYKQLQQLKINSLKTDVHYRMLNQKCTEVRKSIQQRDCIQKQMRNATFTQFAKNVLEYHKSRKLALELKEAEEKEAQLVCELKKLELLAAAKEKVNQQIKGTRNEFQKFELPSMQLMEATSTFAAPYAVAPSDSGDEMLRQIRARCNQRQQLWNQEHSFTSPASKKPSSICQKRSLVHVPSSNQDRYSKIMKTLSSNNLVAANTKNLTAINKQPSKIKILSVETVEKATKPVLPQGGTNDKLQKLNAMRMTSQHNKEIVNSATLQLQTPKDCLSKNVLPQTALPKASRCFSQTSPINSQTEPMLSPTPHISHLKPKVPFTDNYAENQQFQSDMLQSQSSVSKSKTHLDYYTGTIQSQQTILQSQIRVTPTDTSAGNLRSYLTNSPSAPADTYEATLQSHSSNSQPQIRVTPTDATILQSQASSIQSPNDNDKAVVGTQKTSQSSTYSQKEMEFRQMLAKYHMEMPVPQPKETCETSRFFKQLKPIGTEELKEITANSTANDVDMNRTVENQYSEEMPALFDYQDTDEFGLNYGSILSPTVSERGNDANNLLAAEPPPSNFNFFNFGPQQPTGSGTSNPFEPFSTSSMFP